MLAQGRAELRGGNEESHRESEIRHRGITIHYAGSDDAVFESYGDAVMTIHFLGCDSHSRLDSP